MSGFHPTVLLLDKALSYGVMVRVRPPIAASLTGLGLRLGLGLGLGLEFRVTVKVYG